MLGNTRTAPSQDPKRVSEETLHCVHMGAINAENTRAKATLDSCWRQMPSPLVPLPTGSIQGAQARNCHLRAPSPRCLLSLGHYALNPPSVPVAAQQLEYAPNTLTSPSRSREALPDISYHFPAPAAPHPQCQQSAQGPWDSLPRFQPFACLVLMATPASEGQVQLQSL